MDENYKMDIVLLQLTAVQSAAIDMELKKKFKKNFPDGLIRHQLLNLLVKVVKDKYIMRGINYLT